MNIPRQTGSTRIGSSVLSFRNRKTFSPYTMPSTAQITKIPALWRSTPWEMFCICPWKMTFPSSSAVPSTCTNIKVPAILTCPCGGSSTSQGCMRSTLPARTSTSTVAPPRPSPFPDMLSSTTGQRKSQTGKSCGSVIYTRPSQGTAALPWSVKRWRWTSITDTTGLSWKNAGDWRNMPSSSTPSGKIWKNRWPLTRQSQRQ